MNVKKYVRALLCLYLTLIITMDAVKAQALKVGDTLPPELWSMPLQVVNHPEGKETLTLSEYKDKLIILDFWATWCAPCIKSLTRLDTLQREFGEQLAVIPITYEPREKVQPMFQKRGWSLPSVVDDTIMKKWFPHYIVPHQVWVRSGEVAGITTHNEATVSNIRKMLNDTSHHMITKRDLTDYKYYHDLSKYVELTETPVLSCSVASHFIDGISSTLSIRGKNDYRYINFINVPILSMYRSILRVDYNRIIVRHADVNRYVLNLKDQIPQLYSYQQISSLRESFSNAKRRTISDLNSVFGFQLDSVKLSVDCYVISDKETLTNDGEEIIDDRLKKRKYETFVALLNTSNLWRPDLPVFVNESTYSGFVETEAYEVLQKDVEKLKNRLSKYGLTVQKDKRELIMYTLTQTTDTLNLKEQ